jgi:uncharacterized metal-binding protein
MPHAKCEASASRLAEASHHNLAGKVIRKNTYGYLVLLIAVVILAVVFFIA